MPRPPLDDPIRARADDAPISGLDAAVRIVGDRWMLLLVQGLLDGPRRYTELAAGLPGIAPNVLARRLRQLEAAGVVVAHPYSRRPLRLSYDLTDAGRGLAGVVALLGHWGAEHAGAGVPLRHAACGSGLEVRLWCPTCEAPVDDPDHDGLHHV